MRIALVSPFPPSKSGIADYSEALRGALSVRCTLDCISTSADCARIPQAHLAIYQVGNNDAHDFVYESALLHPGIVVLHDANLHYLIADITIKRGNWDAYMDAVAFDAGPQAMPRAQAVRRLEVGPDYLGVPMLRRLLQHARGLVVHSQFVADTARCQGYAGPLAVIPHGAWLPDADGAQWRARLGVPDAVPLVGIFGHLKPYKRIAETLRAFRRIVLRNPFARLLLVGEEHPDLPLGPLLDGLDLRGHVHHVGFAPIDDFVGYMAACDVIVNLRYPTVGESSGSMLRALGLGKPVLVSEVGAFAEFPDDVCLKIPVGAPLEEELLYEYLLYLCENSDAARAFGNHARQWVADTCNWDRVARLYLDFCNQVLQAQAFPSAPLSAIAASPLASLDFLQEPSPAPDTEAQGLGEAQGMGEAHGMGETHSVGEPSSASLSGAGAPPDALPVNTSPEITPCADAGEKAAESGEDVPAASPAGQQSVPDQPGNSRHHPDDDAIAVEAPIPDPSPEASTQPATGDGASSAAAADSPQLGHPLSQEMLRWAPNRDARDYLLQHLSRLLTTLEMLPQGDETKSVLEMGCYMQITPLLSDRKAYGEVRGCYFGTLGEQREETAIAPDGRRFSCVVDCFDAERDIYPYPDERFDAVICTELFEHLGSDPLHCLTEIHRILKPNGHLLLSTPNVCSTRAVAAILTGYHPGFFPAFMRPVSDGPVDPRHHREYAPREIRQALADCGFSVQTLVTGPYWSAPTPEFAWVEHLLEKYELDQTERGECIFALARKTGPIRNRFPDWLYYGSGHAE